MLANQNKIYYELHAKNRLVKIFGIEITLTDKAESPDWQVDSIKSGIEVVCDVYGREKELFAFIFKYDSLPIKTPIPQKKLDKLVKLGGEFKYDAVKQQYTSFSGPTAPNNPTHCILTIAKKLEKLNSSSYKKFLSNQLYVFVDTVSLFPSYVDTVIDEVNRINQDIKFDTIYLDGFYEIWKCEMNNSLKTHYQLTKEVQDKIENLVRVDINKINSKEGIE